MALDRYLDRIGATSGDPDLTTLAAVVAGHVASIPFENLDAFTGVEPALDPDGLVAKLVDSGRGGWCFEQNALLRDMLTALGYRVTGLAARVRYRRPPDAPETPRSHMLLRVDGLGERPDDGPHLVDVGFGGGTPTGVLRLVPGEEQPTPHEPCRIVEEGAGYVTEIRLGGEWTPLYWFDLTPQLPADYGVTNYYLSHHPDSHFRHGLMVSLAQPGRRLAFTGRKLSTYPIDGPPEQRDVDSVAEARAVLESVFGLDLSAVRGLDDRIATVIG